MTHLAEQARLVMVNADRRGAIKTAGTLTIQLGRQGAGTGSQPALAGALARQHLHEIKSALVGAELVILVTGLGKGTGSGATPVVVECARVLGAQTLVLAYLPGDTASPRIIRQARAALTELQQTSTSVLTLQQSSASHSEASMAHLDLRHPDLAQARLWCQSWVTQGLSILADNVFEFGWDAVDFKCFLDLPGRCAWGAGAACGPSRAEEALSTALASLREASSKLAAAHGVVHLITTKQVPGLSEIKYILAQTCHPTTKPEPFRIFYALQDDSIQEDEMRIQLLTKAMPRQLRIATAR
jgi:cell division protein FtsZ